MQQFNYADNRAIHLLATYISEGYLFPDVIEKDCKFMLVTPRVIHQYKFIWNSKISKVTLNVFTNTIYIPRHINDRKINSKLESIIYFGFDIFNILSNRELFYNNLFQYIRLKLRLNKTDVFSINKRLKKFFGFLEEANRSLIKAYNNYPNNPVNFRELDAAFVKYQSHIFLASTLFELYHPFELL